MIDTGERKKEYSCQTFQLYIHVISFGEIEKTGIQLFSGNLACII
jgi:hypothetical protein